MISLLIPTINRSDFLIKYLIYLKCENFDGQVLIGDSSEEDHYKKTEIFIANFKCKFEIKQYPLPNLYPHKCIQEMQNDIRYPYSMYICDDDIIVVNTLKKCIKYLENNPDYSAVGGVAIAALISKNNYSKIVTTKRYPVREITGGSSADRINDLMRNYYVIGYSLSRTDQFKKRWPKNVLNHDKALGTEVLPCAYTVAQGKVKMLEDLFVVRQIHERRIILPNFIDTILQPHWSSSANFCIEYLAKYIASSDSISFDEASSMSHASWEGYLNDCLYGHLKEKQKNISHYIKLFEKIRSLIKSQAKIRKMFQILRLHLTDLDQKETKLQFLLKPSSPFHNDFMPIYNVITNNDGLVDKYKS